MGEPIPVTRGDEALMVLYAGGMLPRIPRTCFFRNGLDTMGMMINARRLDMSTLPSSAGSRTVELSRTMPS